jgi:hypothetical protein
MNSIARLTLLASTLVLCVVLSGCKRGRGIEFSYSLSRQFDVNNGMPINLPIDILLPDIESNSEKEFTQNDTRSDKIKDIKLTNISLTIVNPPNQRFSF